MAKSNTNKNTNKGSNKSNNNGILDESSLGHEGLGHTPGGENRSDTLFNEASSGTAEGVFEQKIEDVAQLHETILSLEIARGAISREKWDALKPIEKIQFLDNAKRAYQVRAVGDDMLVIYIGAESEALNSKEEDMGGSSESESVPEKVCNFFTGELKASLSESDRLTIEAKSIDAYAKEVSEGNASFGKLGSMFRNLESVQGVFSLSARNSLGLEGCCRELGISGPIRSLTGCSDFKHYRNFSQDSVSLSELKEIELDSMYSWRDSWNTDAESNSRWLILRTNDPKDRVMRVLGSILPYFPVAMQNVLDFIKDPNILINIHESLVERHSTIKWGYNTYRENNWRYSITELYQEISKKFSNTRKEDGNGLMLFAMLQLALIDLRPSRYVYEDAVFTLPVHMPVLNAESLSIDLGLAVRRNAYRQLLVKFEDISNKFIQTDQNGVELFKAGSPMIKGDVKMYLTPRRVALHRLLSNVTRLESDLNKLCMYVFLKTIKAQGEVLDVLGDTLEHNLVCKCARNLNFVVESLSNADGFLTQIATGLHGEVEAKLALERIAEHIETNPDLELTLLSDELPEHMFIKSVTFEGLHKGLMLVQGMECDGNVVIAQRTNSYVIPVFKNIETHDYKNTSLKLSEFKKQLASSESVDSMFKTLENELSDQDLFTGFITNIGERLLWRHVLKSQGNKLFFTYDAQEDLDFLVHTGLDMLQKPVVVYPFELKRGFNCTYIEENYIAESMVYLTDPVLAFVLRKLQNLPSKTARAGKSAPKVNLMLPIFSSRDHVATDYLDSFAHGPADRIIEVKYNPGDELIAQGASAEGYAASYKLANLLSGEILRETEIFYDPQFRQAAAYNRRVRGEVLDMLQQLESDALNIEQGKTRIAWERALSDYAFLKDLISRNLVVRKLIQIVAAPIISAMAKDMEKTYRVLQREQKVHLYNDVALQVVRMLNNYLQVIDEEELENIITRAKSLTHFRHQSLLE